MPERLKIIYDVEAESDKLIESSKKEAEVIIENAKVKAEKMFEEKIKEANKNAGISLKIIIDDTEKKSKDMIEKTFLEIDEMKKKVEGKVKDAVELVAERLMK